MPSTMDPVVEALQHLLKHPYAQAIRRLIYSKSIHEAMAEVCAKVLS